MPDEVLTVVSDGARLFTVSSGAGTPVVLCHGGPGLWDYLGPLAHLLDDRARVVRFDQRGCGRSTGAGPFTVAQAVEDLDRVRRAYGFERWVVVGHSWGALLALHYAAAHPDRVTSLVCIAAGGVDRPDRTVYRQRFAERLGADFPRWEQLRAARRTPEQEREFCLLQWRPDFVGPHAAQHAAAMWDTRPAGTEVNLDANRELPADPVNDDLRPVVARVRCVVLVLSGADDPRPWTDTDTLLAALPHGERVVVPDAGHAPWAEQPAIVRAALSAVISASGD